MPRKSLRTSDAAALCSSSKRPPSSGSPSASKRAKRQSTSTASKGAPTQSKYFSATEDELSDPDSASESESVAEKEESGYEDEDASATSPSASEEEDDAAEYSSEEEKPKPKKRGRPSKGDVAPSAKSVSKGAKGEELWRPGVKTGLGPGTQVVIKKPKARETGNTPYTDDTIHPNTMLFLGDLKANNDREWLKMHDPDYRASLKDFNSFLECLTQKVIEADETVPELPVKDITFRIHRDIRFSKDPTPYKTHFSAAWSRTGRKGPYACYYVQIKPGGSFVGGGLWMPEAQALATLRRDIDRRPHRVKRVLVDARLRKHFFGGIADDEKKAVKAFVGQNAENALKTKPKGYDADHKDIDLLRLRNFTIGKKLTDQEVVGNKGLGRIAELISVMVPFITYLNSVVMPDAPDEPDDTTQSGEASDSGNGE